MKEHLQAMTTPAPTVRVVESEKESKPETWLKASMETNPVIP